MTTNERLAIEADINLVYRDFELRQPTNSCNACVSHLLSHLAVVYEEGTLVILSSRPSEQVQRITLPSDGQNGK